jgi:hypothetical protein
MTRSAMSAISWTRSGSAGQEGRGRPSSGKRRITAASVDESGVGAPPDKTGGSVGRRCSRRADRRSYRIARRDNRETVG